MDPVDSLSCMVACVVGATYLTYKIQYFEILAGYTKGFTIITVEPVRINNTGIHVYPFRHTTQLRTNTLIGSFEGTWYSVLPDTCCLGAVLLAPSKSFLLKSGV